MTDAEGLADEAEMIAECDPGIREVVRWLNEHAFDTCDSGDGRWKFRCPACQHPPGEKHDTIDCGRRYGKIVVRRERPGCALDYPHVFVQVDHRAAIAEADRLVCILRGSGVTVVQVGALDEKYKPAGAWIQLTYDPVSETSLIELAHLDDELLANARPVRP